MYPTARVVTAIFVMGLSPSVFRIITPKSLSGSLNANAVRAFWTETSIPNMLASVSCHRARTFPVMSATAIQTRAGELAGRRICALVFADRAAAFWMMLATSLALSKTPLLGTIL